MSERSDRFRLFVAGFVIAAQHSRRVGERRLQRRQVGDAGATAGRDFDDDTTAVRDAEVFADEARAAEFFELTHAVQRHRCIGEPAIQRFHFDAHQIGQYLRGPAALGRMFNAQLESLAQACRVQGFPGPFSHHSITRIENRVSSAVRVVHLRFIPSLRPELFRGGQHKSGRTVTKQA